MFVFEDCSLTFLYIFLGENDGIKVMNMWIQLGGSTTHQQPLVYEFNQIPSSIHEAKEQAGFQSSENVVYRGSSPVILIIYIRADLLC